MRRVIPLGKMGSLNVAANQLVTESAVLVRNVVLARALAPDDMGFALILGVVIRCMEMISDVAAERFLVQAADGNRWRVQANAHGVEIGRGVLSAAVLLSLAYPLSLLFQREEAAWALAALGLIPLVRGFAHLDHRRFHRALAFRATLVVEGGAALIGTLAAWPVAVWCGDYTAFCWIALLQAVSIAGLSHLVARRRYRARVDRKHLGRILSFGWPLLVNGLLMLGVFQGDRLVAAAAVPAAELARYAIALQLALLPVLVMARCVLTVMLPAMARHRSDPGALTSRYRLGERVVAVAAVLVASILPWLSGPSVDLLFGTEYRAGQAVLVWLGAAMAFRMLRVMPATASLALGDSRALLLANLLRIVGLLAAVIGVASGMGLTWIVACACAGELLAAVGGCALLWRRHGVGIGAATVLAAAGVVASAYPALATNPGFRSVPAVLLLAALGLALLALSVRRPTATGDARVNPVSPASQAR